MENVHVNGDGHQLDPLQQNTGVIIETIVSNGADCAIEKKRIKHVSALSAAAGCRSAVQHAHLHIISNRPGDFAHSATNISYDM